MFGDWLLEATKNYLKAEPKNVYAEIGLKFIASFLMRMNANDDSLADTHPLLATFFKFLLENSSNKANVRARMFQMIALLMDGLATQKRSLEDDICNELQEMVLDALQTDSIGKVRRNMLLAIHHLQDTKDVDCLIVATMLHHMECDPVAIVRMAALSNVTRKHRTLPNLLARLFDVDAKVRKHCVLQLCAIPLIYLTRPQRMIVMQQILADATTRKVSNIALSNSRF